MPEEREKDVLRPNPIFEFVLLIGCHTETSLTQWHPSDSVLTGGTFSSTQIFTPLLVNWLKIFTPPLSNATYLRSLSSETYGFSWRGRKNIFTKFMPAACQTMERTRDFAAIPGIWKRHRCLRHWWWRCRPRRWGDDIKIIISSMSILITSLTFCFGYCRREGSYCHKGGCARIKISGGMRRIFAMMRLTTKNKASLSLMQVCKLFSFQEKKPELIHVW